MNLAPRVRGASITPSLFLLALVLALPTALRADNLPVFTGYVVDQANIIDAQSKAQLIAIASQLDHAGSAQLALVTVPSLGDQSIEEFAVDLVKKWGLGHGKKKSDGILIVLVPTAPGHAKLRVEVGYGMEGILPDGKVGAFNRDVAGPLIHQNKYGPAMVALATSIAQVIGADVQAGGDSAAGAKDLHGGTGIGMAVGPNNDSSHTMGLALAVLCMGALLIVMLTSASRRQFPGRGILMLGGGLAGVTVLGLFVLGGLGGWLMLLGGLIANAFAFANIRGHRCPKCGKWMTIDRRMIVEPTYYSTGLNEIREACTNCSYRNRREEILAARTPPSYSGGGGGYSGGDSGGSSDSGGGFSGGGGGESGGGGASSDI